MPNVFGCLFSPSVSHNGGDLIIKGFLTSPLNWLHKHESLSLWALKASTWRRYLSVDWWNNARQHWAAARRAGREAVNVSELPEAIDEAERNWLNRSMTWSWRQCVSCLEFNFSSSLLQHDSRKSNDVSLLNSISWGTDHFNSGGENKQALTILQLLPSNLCPFSVFFLNYGSTGLIYTAEIVSIQLGLSPWLANL